jgi:rare lipoprotein A
MVGYPAGSADPVPEAASPAAMPGDPGPSAGSGSAATPGLKTQAGRTYEVFGVQYRVMNSAQGYEETGFASWYGEQFHGRPTASGETYDMHRHSAAHRTLPLHTWVEVTNLDNGRSLVLKVNDRGPFAHTGSRILDLSYAAARELGVVGPGTAPVRVRALDAEERGRSP